MRPNLKAYIFAIVMSVTMLVGTHTWADSSDVIWSTYLGGSSIDQNYANALDGSGKSYVIGPTLSTDFPTTSGAFAETLSGGWDVYVAKLNSTGNALDYATYLGGSGSDHAFGLAVDASGNAYVTGYTYSKDDFPVTVGVVQDTFAGGSWDAFVTKINAAGSALDYSTYLGGSYNDAGYGIAVDGSGNATMIGRSESSNFPVTPEAFDTTYHGSGDVLVAQLNATGSALIYCTFIGGYASEYGRSVVLDDAGNAYLAGDTESPDFPANYGAFDSTFNGWKDAFVAKLNTTGSDLTYATFLGGDDPDIAYGIAIDEAGKAHAVGYTESSGFPVTSGALDESYNGGQDAFFIQLNASGSDLDYGSFLGGTADDQGNDIDLDASGKVYLIGSTYSTDFPVTTDAYDTTHNGSRDVFVARVDLSSSTLEYATFLGGSSYEFGYGIVQDDSGNVYLSGTTNSSNFPTTVGALDDTLNSTDAWVAKLNIGEEVAYGAIGGNVSEDGGSPLTGAVVTATGPSSGSDTTDGSGNYLIETLLPGSYDVAATATGYYSETVLDTAVVADDTTTVDFQLNPEVGAIAGNVSEDGGGPIAGAVVDAVGPSSASDTTDASGNYLIESLLPGSYDVTATATGYYPETVLDTAVVADDTTMVNFLLTPEEVAPPETIDDLTVTLSKTDLVLQWSAVTNDTSGAPLVVDLYRIYRDTLPDFVPGSPLDSTASLIYVDNTGVVGDTGTHYYYVVMAVAGGQEAEPSNRVGEFDKELSNGAK